MHPSPSYLPPIHLPILSGLPKKTLQTAAETYHTNISQPNTLIQYQIEELLDYIAPVDFTKLVDVIYMTDITS